MQTSYRPPLAVAAPRTKYFPISTTQLNKATVNLMQISNDSKKTPEKSLIKLLQLFDLLKKRVIQSRPLLQVYRSKKCIGHI